jgi:hypothetical protein
MIVLSLLLMIGCEDDAEPTQRDCDERSLFYVDADGDGFGDPTQVVLACELSSGLSDAGLSDNGDDCDDSDAAITTACTDTDTGEPPGPADSGGTDDSGAGSDSGAGA